MAIPIGAGLLQRAGVGHVAHDMPPFTYMTLVYIGCAGWALPRASQTRFPHTGSHLEHYAARFPAVEINSCFYRAHRPTTYARWAATVPHSFRFSLKIPRTITHELGLRKTMPLLETFLAETSHLGEHRGCLLVQLPPRLEFDLSLLGFFRGLRERFVGSVACEPRHESWFAPRAQRVLEDFCIAGVAADPPRGRAGIEPHGWRGLAYYRWHGSPRTYYSSYDPITLRRIGDTVATLGKAGIPVWCIFDNTALSAATDNALELLHYLDGTEGSNPVSRLATARLSSPRRL
jgi:uncharacterized protein YecE (DUF72 family)